MSDKPRIIAEAQRAWPKEKTCHTCKSVLKVERHHVHPDPGPADPPYAALYDRWDCPVCGAPNAIEQKELDEWIPPVRDAGGGGPYGK